MWKNNNKQKGELYVITVWNVRCICNKMYGVATVAMCNKIKLSKIALF